MAGEQTQILELTQVDWSPPPFSTAGRSRKLIMRVDARKRTRLFDATRWWTSSVANISFAMKPRQRQQVLIIKTSPY
jgi:hypothetical protein